MIGTNLIRSTTSGASSRQSLPPSRRCTGMAPDAENMNRANEVAIRTMCYNVELVARSQAKDGRLTQDHIATIAA